MKTGAGTGVRQPVAHLADGRRQTVDQITNVVKQIRERRTRDDYRERPGCGRDREDETATVHALFSFLRGRRSSSCQMYQRSPMFLGVPFNIALLRLADHEWVAQVWRLLPGDFHPYLGDVHLYFESYRTGPAAAYPAALSPAQHENRPCSDSILISNSSISNY